MHWYFDRAEGIYSLFEGAEAFNQPVSMIDTSRAASAIYMFKNAVMFNQPVDMWETSKMEYMSEMFNGAICFIIFNDCLDWVHFIFNTDISDVICLCNTIIASSTAVKRIFDKNIIADGVHFGLGLCRCMLQFELF